MVLRIVSLHFVSSHVHSLCYISLRHFNAACADSSPQPPFYSRDVGEMYDGILHKPLLLPPGKSDAVCSLLVGLLQKDQHRRLGAIADFVSVSREVKHLSSIY